MEPITTSPLFSLTIDPLTKQHLNETAKWAKILAIVGLVFIVLILLFGVVAAVMFSSAVENSGVTEEGNPSIFNGLGAGLAAFYFIIVSAIWFFPFLYLLRFANGMKLALAKNDQNALNHSVHYLKRCFKFLGIITIIVLVMYALLIIFGIFYSTGLNQQNLN